VTVIGDARRFLQTLEEADHLTREMEIMQISLQRCAHGGINAFDA